MLIDNKALTALREGRWEMPCARIRLERLGDAEPTTIEGPGRIYQGPDRRLQYSVIQTGFPMRKTSVELISAHAKEGEPLPLTEYFRFTATDMYGNEWVSDQVRPEDSFRSLPAESALYQGPIAQLRGSAERPTAKSSRFTGRIFAPGRIKLHPNERSMTITERPPDRRREGWNLDVMAGRAGDYPIWIRQEENGELVVTAFGGDDFPPWFARRLLEAMRFVFAMPLQWSTVGTYGPKGATCVIDDVRSQPPQSNVMAPIHPGVQHAEQHQPLLLDCYATALARDPEPWIHPLSLEWHIVQTASARSLEMYGTALSIAIEAVLKLVPTETFAQSEADLEEQKAIKQTVKRIGKEMKAWKVDKRLRERICSYLGEINRESPKQQLRRLAAAGLIDEHLIEVWSWLRNPSTHGNRAALSDVRELGRACDGVLSLLYQLTFAVTGYQGHFLDTGGPNGWQYRPYPRPKADQTTTASE